MGWWLLAVLAACGASARMPERGDHVHSVTCAGVRVPVPASLYVVQATTGELIAASPDVALAVFEDGPVRTGRNTSVIEQDGDNLTPMYLAAFRDADRCTFRAVALLPASPDGLAVVTAVAGRTEPGLIVGSPRVPRKPALDVLVPLMEGHL